MLNKHLTKYVEVFVQSIVDQGIKEVVISPGSRSTPLALACEIHPLIRTWIHPDERSAAFFALGRSQGTSNAIGLICTSGTAASNYLPAITEAGLMHRKLLIMTTDRPFELTQIGAPQAIDQTYMYQNYVSQSVNFPVADGSVETLQGVQQKIYQTLSYMIDVSNGPVHYNIQFREPLIVDIDYLEEKFKLNTEHENNTNENSTNKSKVMNSMQMTADSMLYLIDSIMKHDKVLFIVGSMMEDSLDNIIKLSNDFHIPLMADMLSHYRSISNPSNFQVFEYDSIFKSSIKEQVKPDLIVKFGRPQLSKSTNLWLKAQSCKQLLIQPSHQLADVFPNHFDQILYGQLSLNTSDLDGLYSIVLNANKGIEDKEVNKEIADKKNENTDIQHQFAEQLINLDHTITKLKDEFLANNSNDELNLLNKFLSTYLSERNLMTLTIGNSMPIRYLDLLTNEHTYKIYSNRGANGIDGIISTGLAIGMEEPSLLIVGDLTFYHDSNGLLMHKLYGSQTDIVLLNNNGGGIFHHLPQSKDERYFERLFGTPMDLDFEHYAKLYHFNYVSFETADDIKKYFTTSQSTSKLSVDLDNKIMDQNKQNKQNTLKGQYERTIFEIKTNRQYNTEMFKLLNENINKGIQHVEF